MTAMKANMTAMDYLASLNQWELEKVYSLTKHPDFAAFLAEPCREPLRNVALSEACNNAGIPSSYSNSPEALHYLVVAIAKQAKGA